MKRVDLEGCQRRLPISVVATLLAFIFLAVDSTYGNSDWLQECGVCHCNWNSGKKTAECRNKGLTLVPNSLSNELQVVDLSDNMIPELRREEFLDVNLQNLHKIFMRNCTLQEINRDAFKGLAVLFELDLSHNLIRILHPGTFSGLGKLRNLVMNYNEIEVLENNLFADLQQLSRVEFKSNRLKRIEIHAFGKLSTLSAVYLESNALTSLRKETFARISKLLHLSLAQNPWNCTCELQEFRDFALANRLYTPPTDCRDPPNLRGKLWNEIPSENFACQPRILGSVSSYIEVESNNVTLPCRIEASPRPNVTWIFNKRSINPNDHRFKINYSIEQNRYYQSNVLTSELHIYGVRGGDKGTYTCIAENRGGRAEAEFQLHVSGDYFGALDVTNGGVIGASVNTNSNMLLIICLIITMFLLLLIIAVLMAFWYCRRIKTYRKDTTTIGDNGLVGSKKDKTHNASLLEGSVIMEMQKSLLTEVNPVEKPPRRSELDSAEGVEEGQELKKTLLNDTQIGSTHHPDEETYSIALSDTAPSRSRHAYLDDSYATSLPPDLLAFPARVPPTSPSMQSSHSNIPEHVIYGIRSPPLASPVYTHLNPHGIYGTTTIATTTPNGFMTLQHPKSRSLALIAAANSRQQQQSPFVPAPVVYSPASGVVMKQGYMTIPRKPRFPSWAPTTAGAHSTQLSEFQPPTSPNPSDTGTATTVELQAEPVYDNLGKRTTAGGNSTLNLHKLSLAQQPATRYTMRDRPLPATPSLLSLERNPTGEQQQQQQHQQQHQQKQPTSKIYEPINELGQNQQYHTATSDTEPLYGTARHHTGPTIVPSTNANTSANISNVSDASDTGSRVAKIPPRPPPKPKKKLSVTATWGGQGSTRQLFDDECEDGTEV